MLDIAKGVSGQLGEMMRKAFPVLRRLVKNKSPEDLSQVRHVWGLVRPSSDVQRIMRDMDRRMQAFEREFFKIPPFRFLNPQVIPIEGVPATDVKFRVDVDVSGFKPEDIKISMKEGKLKIEASMDRTEDGTRIKQHLVREFTLPPNLDEKSVESLLHDNGVLTIEASTKSEGAKKLPISSETGEDQKKLKSNV